ncbi:MAG: S10 family serine carboxypeptidase-like protein [Steroidobacteraceae bacterium]
MNDTGKLMGTIFFIAYVADHARGAPPRPLTFLWNGGPGSNSAQIQTVGYGPKRLKTPDTYPQWTPGLKTPIVDNPQTWLATSDLVFVDPAGTGFSRATSKRYMKILYTTRGDAEAVAEFIRIYLNRNNRWHSPLFIGGESYGTWRAEAVADALELRRTRLDGVLLMSGAFDLGQKVPKALNTALDIDHLTATGYYFRLLAPALQSLPQDQAIKHAVDWARRVWAPALAHPEDLNIAQRTAVIDGLRRYTGMNPKYVNWQTLTVKDFTDNLLRYKDLELGRYDSRMKTKYRGHGVPWSPLSDPSLRPELDLMQGTSIVFNDYVRDTLRFSSDLLYQGPFGGAFHPQPLNVNKYGYASDWMAMRFAFGPYDSSTKEPPLRVAMELNPDLRVMNMTGIYNASCAAKDEQVAAIDPQFKGRVTDRCYPAGHMIYTDRIARIEAQHDFAEFVRGAVAAQSTQ